MEAQSILVSDYLDILFSGKGIFCFAYCVCTSLNEGGQITRFFTTSGTAKSPSPSLSRHDLISSLLTANTIHLLEHII
jgi:hypothetical protein